MHASFCENRRDSVPMRPNVPRCAGCGRVKGKERRKIESKGLRCADVPMVTLGFGFLHLNPGSR